MSGFNKRQTKGHSNDDGSKKVYIRCCGSRTQEDGYCKAGKGFYITMNCPILCGVCMHDNLEDSYLTWEGYCWRCKDLTGDRFEFINDHWRVTESAPQKMLDWQGNLQQLLKLNKTIEEIGDKYQIKE